MLLGIEAKRGVEFRHPNAMPLEFGDKWVTECLNTSFPVPTLLNMEYSAKLIQQSMYIKLNTFIFVLQIK